MLLVLAACSAPTPTDGDGQVVTPISYPVPDDCPSGKEFGLAYVDDPAWARAVNADLLSGDLRSALPAGGCAYFTGEVGTAKNGIDKYQRVIVAYFNLDTPDRLTRDDLRAWGLQAGGVPAVLTDAEGNPTGETSDTSLTLPDNFTYFDSAGVSWVDGVTTIAYSDSPIPAYTQGASGTIQFYLKSERASAIEDASVNGGAVADAMSGIIAIDATSTTITLTAIDPTTGATTATRTFQGAQSIMPRVNMASSYIAQQGFSPDLTRVAATTTIATDNSTHVGWITQSGQFVDVTQAVAGAQSDFADTVQHSSPVFGADGAFYYLDDGSEEVKRIPASATTADAVAGSSPETVMSDVGESFFVWPSGTITPCSATCAPHSEGTQPGPFGQGATVNDWLDQNTLVCTTNTLTEIDLYAPYAAGSDPMYKGRWACGAEGTDVSLLPKTERENWSPIGSSDGQTVAFISSPASGSETPELFTIPRGGGDPKKLTTQKSFARTETGWLGSTNRVQLLDWR
ncbi:hypothetical protein QE430_003324 [Microbacterium testaceum]|nr:hypothetical protein [Microbacterium testaceum]